VGCPALSWRLSRIVAEDVNPQQPRQPDVEERQQKQHGCDNRKYPQVKRFRKKRPDDKISRNALRHIEHVVKVHCAKKISGFFVEFGLAMAAVVVHFWKAKRKQAFVPEDFSFVTIRTLCI
jgi:hypothetical protein